MDIVQFVVMALATLRVTQLLVNEEGPGEIFCRIRTFMGVKETVTNGMVLREAKNKWGELMLCHKCVSVWVGLLFSLLQMVIPGPALDFFFLAMSLSGVASFLGTYF